MGFWSDLVDAGKDAIKAKATEEINKSGGIKTAVDPVPYQNAAVSEMGLALSQYHAGQITNLATRIKIDSIDKGYTIFCQQLGTSRALKGAGDLHSLAVKVIADLVAADTTGGGTGTGTGAGTIKLPPPLTGGIGTVSNNFQAIALVAGIAYLLLKKR